jgi:hypothetical protein
LLTSSQSHTFDLTAHGRFESPQFVRVAFARIRPLKSTPRRSHLKIASELICRSFAEINIINFNCDSFGSFDQTHNPITIRLFVGPKLELICLRVDFAAKSSYFQWKTSRERLTHVSRPKCGSTTNRKTIRANRKRHTTTTATFPFLSISGLRRIPWFSLLSPGSAAVFFRSLTCRPNRHPKVNLGLGFSSQSFPLLLLLRILCCRWHTCFCLPPPPPLSLSLILLISNKLPTERL